MTKDDEITTSTSDMVVVGLPVTYVASPTQGTAILANPNSKTDLLETQTTDLNHSGEIVDHDSSTNVQSILSTSMTNPVYNSLDQIQIITVNTPDLLNGTLTDSSGRIMQVLPALATNPEFATIIAVNPTEYLQQIKDEHSEEIITSLGSGEHQFTNVTTNEAANQILMPPPPSPIITNQQSQQQLPSGCPGWAARLKDCEKIGESYRGYVESEVELDLLLTYHKQQTQSFWGTRQSPSPGKPSTRLMWKSQYVPFDGIPFVNTGSRAVVQECQYGPRRKGSCKAKGDADTRKFKQTCPARIYVKKVKKFPEFAVDVNIQDKKALKFAMDNAFQELKQRGVEGIGQERHYVQLPTAKAHQFHDDDENNSTITAKINNKTDIITCKTEEEENKDDECNIHPKLATKIRELVAGGEIGVYNIRKQLRNCVTKDMYPESGVAERHDWTLFPTINNIKNHIHQALKDIESGTLALTATTVNVEIITTTNDNNTLSSSSSSSNRESGSISSGEPIVWPITSGAPIPETVTVTLTQSGDESQPHVISKIETHLSDGSTHVSDTVTPETAQLLSRLHPTMFPIHHTGVFPTALNKNITVHANGDIVVGSTMVEDNVMDTSTHDTSLTAQEPLQIEDDTCAQMMEEDDLTSKDDHLSDTSIIISTLAASCDSAIDPLESVVNL